MIGYKPAWFLFKVAWPSGKAEACKASIPSSNLGATFVYDSSFRESSVLYLIATPIGNLKDITLRALETLQACDYILCEDTRHSLILLKHYQIHKPLVSFHKFSEASKEDKIIQDLKDGKTIGLISDAGTPGISDPGTRLVQRCIEESLKVSALPGPSAAIMALCISGMDTDRFQFYGFLPKSSGALKTTLSEILKYPHTTICYESPERISRVLDVIQNLDSRRRLVIARELTKKFEELLRGTAQELLDRYEEKKFKGEIVMLIEGQKESPIAEWENLSIEEHVAKIQQEDSLSLSDAIKKTAEQRSIPKRMVYNKIHQK
jgi:16S rRNA (cytidine1402-2'-O)-methyltransferase